MLPGLGSAIAGEGLVGIQFVGGATASKVGDTVGNSTIPLNSGLTGGIASAAQTGDFVLGVYHVGSSAGVDRSLAITDGSTGYTLIGSELYVSESTRSSNLRLAYKFITSDTDTTFGPTGATTDAGAMVVYVFRGVNTTTPLDVTPTTYTNNGLGGQTLNPPAITPVTAGAAIVFAAGGSGLNDDLPIDPGGLTALHPVFQSDTYASNLGVGCFLGWTSGSYDPGQYSTPTRTAVSAMTIALRPA